MNKLSSIIVVLLELITGILLIINPTGFTKTIIVVAGVIILVIGIVNIVRYFTSKPLDAALEHSLSSGLIMGGLGLFCIYRSDWFIKTFPILSVLYGLLVLVLGFEKIESAINGLRLKLKYWWVMLLNAICSILFAIIIITNPFATTEVLWLFIGIVLIVEAIIDLISLIFTKKED